MPIDTSMYQNMLRPPKSVAEYDNEAMQGQQNRLALQLEQNKASEFQRNIAGENKLSQLLAAGGDPAAVTNGLASAGYGSKALTYAKTQQDLKKGAADVGHIDAQTGKLKQEATGLDYDQREKKRTKAITDIAAFTTPQEAMASLKAHADAGDIAPEQAQMIAQGIPQNPADFPKWQIGMLQRIMSAKDAMGQLAPDANAKLTAQTSTDNNAATNDTSRANNAATVGATIRGQNMVDARAKEAADGKEASFTPGAIDNAAARYNIDGTLPPMGMGNAGSQARSAILNRAAEQAGANGLSPDEQRIAQIGNKGNSAAISKLQQQKTMVGAFERNFNMNADIVKEFSAKVDRTGVPIMNKWINAGKRAVAGDPELSAFDASVKAVSNEYAKIVSGSMGNTSVAEGEIKKIEALLNAAQTPQQVTAVVNLMQRETHNRMQGFDDEMSSLRESMKQKKAGAAKPSLSDIFKNP